MSSTSTQIKPATRPLFGVDDQTFREKFNRACFEVSHQLANHPLFEFGRLFELLKVEKSKIYWDMGDVKVNQKWKDIQNSNCSVDEAFSQIEKSQAWMVFRSIQRDPEYKALVKSYVDEIEERSGLDFKRFVKMKDAIIFVTSPGRKTTYHIDRECSFLLQIRGNKVMYTFDKDDRAITTDQELEEYWTVNNNAANYKEQYQNRAQEWQLVPGNGVHIPVGSPHWLKNGNDVSISLNINVHMHDFVRANVYRANYYIRKAGFKPAPPGKSKLGDVVKRNLMGGLIAARRIVKPKKSTISNDRDGKSGTPWRG